MGRVKINSRKREQRGECPSSQGERTWPAGDSKRTEGEWEMKKMQALSEPARATRY